MKKIVGFTKTQKGGYWVYTTELIDIDKGKGNSTAQYHLRGEAMLEALSRVSLKSPDEIIGMSAAFDANNQFASSAVFFPNQAVTKQ